VVFYDNRTALVFSGDFLMPGRLLVDDAATFHQSALRLIDFLQTRPVSHILGGHIELDSHAPRAEVHRRFSQTSISITYSTCGSKRGVRRGRMAT
jgi:hypothetical protein